MSNSLAAIKALKEALKVLNKLGKANAVTHFGMNWPKPVHIEALRARNRSAVLKKNAIKEAVKTMAACYPRGNIIPAVLIISTQNGKPNNFFI